MKIRRIALLFILIIARPAFAWNDFGHMAVAALAYPHLTPAAKQRIAALLQRNPNYGDWIRNVDPAERERSAFMQAALWSDVIKHDTFHIEPENGEPDSGQIIGYRDTHQHRSWHYINLPFSPDNTPLQPTASPNLQTQIAALRRALQSADTQPDTKSYSLVWLLHLVGDAHQPLHAAARFTRDFPHGDQGGNAVIVCEKNCNDNLHAFWDNALGTGHNADVVLQAIAHFPGADPRRTAIIDENIWLRESAEIAQRFAYAPPIAVNSAPVTLSKTYKTNAYNIATQQAAVAGMRLANLLNQIFQ